MASRRLFSSSGVCYPIRMCSLEIHKNLQLFLKSGLVGRFKTVEHLAFVLLGIRGPSLAPCVCTLLCSLTL